VAASQFYFLDGEFTEIYKHARKAEELALSDARSACFYSRIALETAVKWMYRSDRTLRSPYETTLSALIHEPTFRNLVGNAVVTKGKIIKDLGNMAAHESKNLSQTHAITAVRELFHFSYWLVRTYGKGQKPPASLAFSSENLLQTTQVEAKTLTKLKQIEKQFQESLKTQEQVEKERLKSEEGRAELEAEIRKLQEEIAKIKKANIAAPDEHDYNEAQTRDAFIDLLLNEAGWMLDDPRDTEFPVTGMPNNTGEGFVDYVLWGQDGKPLGLVEAKRTRRDPREGQRQAELYADALERQFAQRPIIFYSNGYEHWIWDDKRYPPRPIQGFMKRDELELAIQRRSKLKKLASESIKQEIAGRYYQTRAIRRIAETFEKDNTRKALLVMATGSGKTRTVIALSDLLMRANWAKRILFLADRVALVNQAAGAFKKFLPNASPVNLVTDKSSQGRVYVSTYPTMMGLINEVKNGGVRHFGSGHFDLIIIDEAHRSVYRKYRAIFDYFDSLLVGLTATPKDEVDHDTYELFDLERGIPTDAYDLDEAVSDGFLVPPKAISVPLKFQRVGIKYDDLSDEEKEEWDALEWDEEGNIPEYIDPAAVNKWLFNEDTVDKVLEHLMMHGLHVEQGDKLGKTIIFAKNHDHAQFIAQRFDENYPHLKGKFARVIDFKTEYAQSLIDDFSENNKFPQIAISVDMLDTGIDVPEVVNLVFFKIVRSKTKFWQMIGRGTRLCPDLFDVGQHKTHFNVFDYCQNFEFFNQNPELANGALSVSLSQRLFELRVDLLDRLKNGRKTYDDEAITQLEQEIAEHLKSEVQGMNIHNFVVRPRRETVEKYQNDEVWNSLGMNEYVELKEQLSYLPTANKDDDTVAKQFDLLVFKSQLALLNSEKVFLSYKKKITQTASSLEELQNVPMVATQIALILEIQTDEFWKDITPTMLDMIRKRLRALVKLVDAKKRPHVFTNFEDEIGEHEEVTLNIVAVGTDMERFKAKARHFLKSHLDHIAIQKIRLNQPLTTQDITEIEDMFVQAGVATTEEITKLKQKIQIGTFIRSLVGLDREAAKSVFAEFQEEKNLTSDQIEFLDMIINYLTERGVMEPRLLYESPFTDINDMGVEGVFETAQVVELINILDDVQRMADCMRTSGAM
jgi:type I restriction enzyme, R subunit